MKPRKPGLLQRVWGFDSRHPLWWDIGPVAVVGLAILIGAAVIDIGAGERVLAIALILMLMVPVVWRRRYPFAVFLSQNVPITLYYLSIWRPEGPQAPAPVDAAIALAFVPVLFNLVLRRSTRLMWVAAGIVAVQTSMEIWMTGIDADASEVATALLGGATIFWLVALIALVIKTRRSFHQSVSDQVARDAVSAERTRIAREMHDIIGHNLAVINALADGGAYAATAAPERAKEALEAIGATSRQALGELRRVLSVLNADDADQVGELAPQPGLSELETLIERVREAGLPVSVRVSGERWDLTENQQLAVYRTVQEALTNVLKHASEPRRAQVTLDYRDDGLAASVGNSGPAVADAGPMRGLAGLRERASAFGGTIEAGPQPAGGWRVALWLPRNGQDQDSQTTPTEESRP